MIRLKRSCQVKFFGEKCRSIFPRRPYNSVHVAGCTIGQWRDYNKVRTVWRAINFIKSYRRIRRKSRSIHLHFQNKGTIWKVLFLINCLLKGEFLFLANIRRSYKEKWKFGMSWKNSNSTCLSKRLEFVEDKNLI